MSSVEAEMDTIKFGLDASSIRCNGEKVYKCELDPETNTTLHLYVFKDVKNVEEIRKNILSGSWKCVIIKPALILHPLQVTAAANKAVLSEKNNTMVSRSVFTEILFNLSISKNISQSLSQFGIEKDTDMLVCFLITPGNDHSKEILSKIDGIASNIDLQLFSDLNKIKKVYKLGELKHEMLSLVISKMMTKNLISH